MNTRIITCPFALFGHPGTQTGAEVLTDALHEMVDDADLGEIPTRIADVAEGVIFEEIALDSLDEVAEWETDARALADDALRSDDFTIWIGGNHLSVAPVYEALGQSADNLVVQFDAHLDIFHFDDCTETPTHGNFIRHLQARPKIVNVGQRDHFLPVGEIANFFETTVSTPELCADFDGSIRGVRQQCEKAKRVWIDLDCDVFDPMFFPAVAQPEPWGLSPEMFLRVFTAIWSPNVAGMSISEFDTGRDQADRSLAALIWLVEHVLLLRSARRSSDRRRKRPKPPLP